MPTELESKELQIAQQTSEQEEKESIVTRFTRTRSFESQQSFESTVYGQAYGISRGDVNKYFAERRIVDYNVDPQEFMSRYEQRNFRLGYEDKEDIYIERQSHLLGVSPRQVEFDDEYSEFRAPDAENDTYYRNNIERHVPSAVVEPITLTALGRYRLATGDGNNDPKSLLFQDIYNRYLARLVREFNLLKELPIYIRHILKIPGYELHDLNPELYLRFLNVGNRLRRLPPLRVRFMKPLENRDVRTLLELEKKVEEIEKSVAPDEIDRTQGGSPYDTTQFSGDPPGTSPHCPAGEYLVPTNPGYDNPPSIEDYPHSIDCSDPLPYLSFILDLLPVVGDVKGVIEAFTGQDLITGDPLPIWQRFLGLLPLVGDIARVGGKITVELTGSFVRRTVDGRVVVEFVDQFGRVVEGWRSQINTIMAGIQSMIRQIKSDWDWFTGNVGVTEAGIQIRIPDEAGDAARINDDNVMHMQGDGGGRPRPSRIIGAGRLTASEAEEIQHLADTFNTEIHIIGSRARGEGRNIYSDLPPGKGDNTRSDIDFSVDGQVVIDTRGQFANLLKEVSRGAGSIASERLGLGGNMRPHSPAIIFSPNHPPYLYRR
ncbi:MAG: pre-toxin TG domain-containing protein [Cyanobacteria bacterium P01_G01_bin.54]